MIYCRRLSDLVGSTCTGRILSSPGARSVGDDSDVDFDLRPLFLEVGRDFSETCPPIDHIRPIKYDVKYRALNRLKIFLTARKKRISPIS